MRTWHVDKMMVGTTQPNHAQLLTIQLAIAFVLFSLDVFSGPGIADGIGYSMVLVLCLWNPKRSHSLAWAGFTTVLVIVAGTISIDGGIGADSWINRALALCSIWVVWFLIRSSAEITRALRVRETEANQASESKSMFLANMSHELRTPLNAIIGFSDLLRLNTIELSMTKRAEYADDIYSSANHLLSLINDVLDLARIGAGKFELCEETFSVNELVVREQRLSG